MTVGPMGEPGPAGAQGEPGPEGPPGLDGAPGPQGIPGADGADGAEGPIGPRGPIGPQGLDGIIGPRGRPGGLVDATATVTAAAPGANPSVVTTVNEGTIGLAFTLPSGSKGDKGDTGDTGSTGPAGTITGATATALAAGATPTIGLGGSASARTLTFGIPAGLQGIQGVQGIQGLKGDKGDKGDVGNTGLQGIKGHTGDQGPKGDPGAVDNVNYADLIGKPATFPPTIGATATTAAAGNHAHAATAITSGTIAAARLPAATATAIGAAELATDAEAIAGIDAARIVTPANLTAWEAAKRPVRNRAVFVGSSNVADGSTPANMWPTKLCNRRGWTKHNYAIGGTSYNYTNPFLTQAQSAVAALTTAQRAEVGHFFVGDASNNTRAKTPYADILAAAKTLYAYIRTNFPNARIVVLPQVWPADTEKYAPTAFFPYDAQWNNHCIAHSAAQKEALDDFSNALFVDYSWTWLTGLDQYMTALADVHPNAAGNTLIANYVDRALDGETIIGSQRWTDVAFSSAASGGFGAHAWLGSRRTGWDVWVDGAAQWTQATTNDWDIATLAYGMRPTYPVLIPAYNASTRDPIAAVAQSNGKIVIPKPLASGTAIVFSGAFQLG